LQRYKKV